MKFCPKCGAILIPKRDKKSKKISCQCGKYTIKNTESMTITEKRNDEKKIEIVDPDQDLESLPISDDIECPKCKNTKAYYWLVQTRAADEPATKFLKCTECKHTWRDYN